VKRCVETGLVQGDSLSVDGSFVEANAAKENRIPAANLSERSQVRFICGSGKTHLCWLAEYQNLH
jgi:hypothetical protein